MDILKEEPIDIPTKSTVIDEEEGRLAVGIGRERQEQFRQDGEERHQCAARISLTVSVWLAVIVALLFSRGFFGPSGRFFLSDCALIAAATTTTACTAGILVAFSRDWSPNPSPFLLESEELADLMRGMGEQPLG